MNTTFDIGKVVHATFYWRNKEDNIHKEIKPPLYSTHGVSFNPSEFASHIEGYELETLLERAIRLDILDSWTPTIILRTINGRLTYEGERALSIRKQWNARVYGKRKK